MQMKSEDLGTMKVQKEYAVMRKSSIVHSQREVLIVNL